METKCKNCGKQMDFEAWHIQQGECIACKNMVNPSGDAYEQGDVLDEVY